MRATLPVSALVMVWPKGPLRLSYINSGENTVDAAFSIVLTRRLTKKVSFRLLVVLKHSKQRQIWIQYGRHRADRTRRVHQRIAGRQQKRVDQDVFGV